MHGWKTVVLAAVCGLLASTAMGQDDPSLAARKKERDRLLKTLPVSQEWNDWVLATDALPPDFDKLPSHPELPDPLTMADGTPVKTPQQWQARRREMLDLLERYAWGRCPQPPKKEELGVVEDKPVTENGRTRQQVTLYMGSEGVGKLVFVVDRPAKEGKFPVYMLPGPKHEFKGWTVPANQRDYVIVLYNCCDGFDTSASLVDAYPRATWTELYRRAWAACRVVDYIVRQPYAAPGQLGITGHSRDGTQAMMAAALDERITCVINSSAGAHFNPVRLANETSFSGGLELATRTYPSWYRPELRFFSGRENKLPFDFNFLPALVAPRPLLNISATNDWVQGPWLVQQLMDDTQRVYKFLGKEDNVTILWRPGVHMIAPNWTMSPEIAERCFDWLDKSFGLQRGNADFSWKPLHPYSFEDWKTRAGVTVKMDDFAPAKLTVPQSPDQWTTYRDQVRKQLQWLLGEGPTELVETVKVGQDAGESKDLAVLHSRDLTPEGCEKVGVTFGPGIQGALFMPKGLRESGKKLPAIVWCPPLNWTTGWGGVYVDWPNAYVALAQSGMVVLVADPIGTGNRLAERADFYQKNPKWSLMGKMVYDTRCAVSALRRCQFVDPAQIYLVGYANGGTVATMAAALDGRVAGLATVAGFTPMRSDTPEKGVGGLARYWKLYGTMPMLGFFQGNEARLPVDFDDMLATLAPRPTLVVSPLHDQYATHADVLSAITGAQAAYKLMGNPAALTNYSPDDYNSFTPALAKYVVQWLRTTAGLQEPTSQP